MAQGRMKMGAGLGFLLLAMLFIAHFAHVTAQSPGSAFVRYSRVDGLPSDHIYMAKRLADGRLWITTDRGVSAFDGKTFENFSIQDGLTDLEIFDLDQDSKGRIWFRTMSGKPCFYLDGKIYNHNDIPALEEVKCSNFLNGFHEDDEGNIYLGSYGGEVFKVDENWNVTALGCPRCRNVGIYPTSMGLVSIDNSSRLRILNSTPEQIFPHTGRDLIYENDYPCKSTQLPDGTILFSFNRNVGITNERLETRNLDGIIPSGKIISIQAIEDGSIYVGTTQGVYHFRDKSFESLAEPVLLKDQNVSAVADLGYEGRFLCTDGGLFYQGSNTIKELANATDGSHFRTMLVLRGSTAFLGLANGNLQKWDLNSGSLISSFQIDSSPIRKIKAHNDRIWITTKSEFAFLENEKLFFPKSGPPRDFDFFEPDSICFCIWNGFHAVKENDWMFPFFRDSLEFLARFDGQSPILEHHPCFVIFKSNENSILWSSTGGVLRKNGSKTTRDEQITQLIGDAKVKQITRLGNTTIFATSGSGIVFSKGNEAFQLSKADGLLSDDVLHVLPDSLWGLWVAFPNGVQLIQNLGGAKANIQEVPQVFLPYSGKNLIELGEGGEDLLILTEKALFALPKSTIGKKEQPPIPSMSSSNKLNLSDTLKKGQAFDHEENDFSFGFRAISFKSLGDVTYRYRLRGLHENWIETRQNSVEYPAVPAGEFQFEVQAKVTGGKWGPSSLSPSFEVMPAFWETWWFITLLVLGLLMLASSIFWLILRSYKRKNLLEHQRIIAEHKALISQMNPHFIFNSLNSIQRFFLTNDVESGNDYLVDFGHLIRAILENGRKEWITLAQEEGLLSLYLKLESLRVKQKFEYEIKIEGLDPQGTMIPPMLLQPFVENAIWHGVSPLAGLGKITILLEKEGNCLKAEVRDNGVGRKKQDLPSNGAGANHRSLATKITQERLSILKLEFPDQVNFEIIDLKDAKGKPCGTVVQLLLPLKSTPSLNPT